MGSLLLDSPVVGFPADVGVPDVAKISAVLVDPAVVLKNQNFKPSDFLTVERPDPKGLSTFSQCTEFLPHRGWSLAL